MSRFSLIFKMTSSLVKHFGIALLPSVLAQNTFTATPKCTKSCTVGQDHDECPADAPICKKVPGKTMGVCSPRDTPKCDASKCPVAGSTCAENKCVIPQDKCEYTTGDVGEKFGEQNFRVLSEMRILAKNKVVILDLVG